MIVDLVNPEKSEIGYKRFRFPDGQPHIEFAEEALQAAIARGRVDVIATLKSGSDILDLGLAVDAIDSMRIAMQNAASAVQSFDLTVNVSYMLGARMDRRIAAGQPATLAVIATMLQSAIQGRATLRILDPHSAVTLQLLPGAVALPPDQLVAFALAEIAKQEDAPPVVIIPDAGAVSRTMGILQRLGASNARAKCSKVRDSQTGKLSGFQLVEGDVRDHAVLIVDDVCDGGGTFTGVANVLRANGAKRVYLCVTHGIFSKGIALSGIDRSYCSDSYGLPAISADRNVVFADNAAVRRYLIDGQERLVVMTDFVRQIVGAQSSMQNQ